MDILGIYIKENNKYKVTRWTDLGHVIYGVNNNFSL